MAADCGVMAVQAALSLCATRFTTFTLDVKDHCAYHADGFYYPARPASQPGASVR